MKILAIRGENLASLAGRFEVDFRSEPLASAGLFAITGPTGAGKSTLLDALCVALYEKTPRLGRASAHNQTIPDVADNSVSPSDPRTLLRRGAAEGFAEVDFIGSDGVPYRARWSVRRAHNKPNGKLQASELALTRLTDQQRLGSHRKTETLEQIKTCVGLSFEQFTRAVLLAQNDFATFLKASDDERAELLQTLTGSEVYSRISMQAYARMRAENEQLARLEAQLQGFAPWPAELRAEKEAALQAQAAQCKALEDEKALLDAHLRWHQRLAELIRNQADAQAACQAARQARADAAPRERRLARIDQVQPALPLCAELDRLGSEQAATSRALAEAQARLTQAQTRESAARAQADAAGAALAQAEDAHTRAQAQLDSAKALDAQLALLAPQCSAAIQAHQAARQQLDGALQQQEQTAQALAANQAALHATRQWLAEHAPLQALAENWAGWAALFHQGEGLLAEQQALHNRLAQQDHEARGLDDALEAARSQHTRLAEAHDAATQTLATRTQACLAFDLDALAQHKQQLEDRREQLSQAEQQWIALQGFQARRQQLAEREQALQTTLNAASALREQLLARRPALEQAQASAEQALRIAELAASQTAETLRSQLQPDAPCPVCGGREHPYANHAPQLDAVLDGLQAHVAQARQALNSLSAELGAAEAELKTSQQQLQAVQAEASQLDQTIGLENHKWRAQPLAATLDALEEPARAPWLAEQLQAIKAALQALAGQEQAARQALRERDAAQAACDKARTALDAATRALAELTTRQQTLAEARKGAHARRHDLELELNQVQNQLDAAFPDAGWRAQWHAEPAGFVAACQARAEAWSRQREQLSQLEQQNEALALTLAGQQQASQTAQQQEQAQATTRQQLESQLRSLQAERATLFDGQPVAAVEAALQQAIARAREQLEQARQAQQLAATERARQDEAMRNTAAQLNRLDSARQAAERALEDWLAGFNQGAADEPLSLEALRTLLQLDSAWIAAERAALQGLSEALVSAEAALAVHIAAREQHESARQTSASAEALSEALGKLQTTLDAASDALNQLKAELAQDDARIRQFEAQRATVEAQRARSRVWSQLGELIGSADGKKFRNFAQQLTLDILLGYANRHLESLARRYRLMRIQDSLGLMVVDQEMGDELRSVHSLSGGESFLVSLALALGLASLSSHRVRVESLFIDEGFGSLDAEALNIAMEALLSLQAQGRKVGVISHVQEMTERIGTRIHVHRQAGGLSRVRVV